MTKTNAFPGRRTLIGIGCAVIALGVAGAAWYWLPAAQAPLETQSAPAAEAVITPASYPAPGKEPSAKIEFPIGASALSSNEIAAALSDHTALLAGGFVEYYAPDGTLHGLAEEKHYSGSWQVRNGDFCTLLEGSDASICSPVERDGGKLYWSMDGEKEASPVTTMPGNPRNLR